MFKCVCMAEMCVCLWAVVDVCIYKVISCHGTVSTMTALIGYYNYC